MPSGATIGICFWLIASSINFELILFGIPTKPNSFLSGLLRLYYFFLDEKIQH